LSGNGGGIRDGRICAGAHRPEAEHQNQHQRGEATLNGFLVFKQFVTKSLCISILLFCHGLPDVMAMRTNLNH